MAQVSVTINRQNYTITCDDGQEERLKELAVYFDHHVSQLADSLGNVADSRLMLLAGLTVCDELMESRGRIKMMEEETGLVSEKEAVSKIDEALKKVMDITERLEVAAPQA